MSRYKDEQCRICRREGQKLFLKGSRCYSDKCSVTRRNYAPGQHGQGKKKLSEYGILESRLDNVIYRVGFGSSRAQARQLVNHGHFDVNGVKTDIPSYLVKPGDVITVRENKKDSKTLKENVEANNARPIPEWLEKNNEKLEAKVLRLAAREDVDLPVEEHLIVELYSK